MSTFEVGLVYSSPSSRKKDKIYYLAIHNKTLVTYRNGRFGRYSTKKHNHALEHNISVQDLCKHWEIKITDLDQYMRNYFSPDEEAKERARKSKDKV